MSKKYRSLAYGETAAGAQGLGSWMDLGRAPRSR